MITIKPTVPLGCKLTGYLYDDPDKRILGEDMVEVLLPNGILVSAGWYPESSPKGSYRVVATEGFHYLRDESTGDVRQASALVEQFVSDLSRDSLFLSQSSSSTHIDLLLNAGGLDEDFGMPCFISESSSTATRVCA